MYLFHDRQDAGRQLAAKLLEYESACPMIIALPRGGVPVGFEVARALKAPLDVWVVCKVRVPSSPALGLGAVAESGFVYLNDSSLRHIRLTREDMAADVRARALEVDARVQLFRGGGPAPLLRNRTVIVVDDGMATGGTARSAIRSIRARYPKTIVFAVPVAAAEAVEAIAPEVEDVVCLHTIPDLVAIDPYYLDFEQILDHEVIGLLDGARRARSEH